MAKMATKRLSSLNSGPYRPDKKPRLLEATASPGKQDHANVSTGSPSVDQGHASAKSSETIKAKSPVYTTKFFSNLAEEVARSFPYEAFARSHGCDVADVAKAISATIIDPLSKPLHHLGQDHVHPKGRAQLTVETKKPTRVAEIVESKLTPKMPTIAGPESGQRTKIAVDMRSPSKKFERRHYSKGFLEKLKHDARPKLTGKSQQSSTGSPVSRVF
ncbi:hypothetical protein BJX99DRAFT_176707 [Aspergillus californicus]